MSLIKSWNTEVCFFLICNLLTPTDFWKTLEQGVHPPWQRIWTQRGLSEPADEPVPQCCAPQHHHHARRWYQELSTPVYLPHTLKLILTSLFALHQSCVQIVFHSWVIWIRYPVFHSAASSWDSPPAEEQTCPWPDYQVSKTHMELIIL